MPKTTGSTTGGSWRKASKAAAAVNDAAAGTTPATPGRVRVRLLILVGLAAWPFVYVYRRLKRSDKTA